MRGLNLTAGLEEEPWDHNRHSWRAESFAEERKHWCVIKLNGYEIGRVEMESFHSNDIDAMLELTAAEWLSERLKP